MELGRLVHVGRPGAFGDRAHVVVAAAVVVVVVVVVILSAVCTTAPQLHLSAVMSRVCCCYVVPISATSWELLRV